MTAKSSRSVPSLDLAALTAASSPDRPAVPCPGSFPSIHRELPVHQNRADAGRGLLGVRVRGHVEDVIWIEYHQVRAVAFLDEPAIFHSNHSCWARGDVGDGLLQPSGEYRLWLYLLEVVAPFGTVNVPRATLGQVSTVMANVPRERTPSCSWAGQYLRVPEKVGTSRSSYHEDVACSKSECRRCRQCASDAA